MHPIFKPLAERQIMTLVSALIVDGRDALDNFDFLPSDIASTLKEKAEALLKIEGANRVNFLAKIFGEGLNRPGLMGIERIDPSWVVEQMRGESPATVAALLVTFPESALKPILKRLPEAVRKRLPAKDVVRGLDPQILKILRHRFDQRFSLMRPNEVSELSFDTLLSMDRRELARVLRGLGLIELGQAFASVGRLALAELCRRLPRASAQELIDAVKKSSRVDAPDIKQAQRFLSRVVVSFDSTDEFFQKAGLWRVSKAALATEQAFRESFRQRIPKDAGQLFDMYLEKATEMELDEGAVSRLQDSIVVKIKELSSAGTISPQWAGLPITLNDQDYLTKLEAAEAKIRSERAALRGGT